MRFERIATAGGTVPSVRGPSITLPSRGRAPDGPAPHARRPGRVTSDRASRVRLQVFDLVAPWIVGLATLAARLATAARGPTDWDSSQYLAAVSHFDVDHGRPQPPGYWLYVAAGRLIHGSGLGTVESLVLVSAVASALAAGLVVVAGRDLGGRWVGLAAGVVVATSPFAWFSGSTVATYSFDLAVAPLLIILAWRARPHSWHGAGALAALGLAAGFRQSEVMLFALLALLAVVGSVRRVREAAVAVVAAAAAVAAWLVPMALAQPGGAQALLRAARSESKGALQTTSVLDHATSGSVNLGTFAAYTTVALAPLAALALMAAVGLGVRAVVRRLRSRPVAVPANPSPAPANPAVTPGAQPSAGVSAHRRRRWSDWTRPWYQSRTVILLAATVPPMAGVALVQFAKGGYLLAYLPGAVIALLLVPGALIHTTPNTGGAPVRRSTGVLVWGVVASIAVVAIAVAGADRFLTAAAVLPVQAHQSEQGLWLTQARYQAPYPDTLAAIRSADAMDESLARLDPLVDARRDVVVIDSVDGGTEFYRNAGWSLPIQRVTLISPGTVAYTELGGSLYYQDQSTVPVAPGGWVYLIAAPNLPGLRQLAGTGKVTWLRHAPRIGDYLVFRIAPGSSILGVHVTVVAGPRPLGSGIVG